MRIVLFSIIVFLGLITDCYAIGRRRVSYNYVQPNPAYAEEVKTAQGVANIMARLRTVGHWGGNPSYEGCGSGPTKEAAYNICCFANSGMQTVDVGYAQDSNGFWYCCRRYK